MSHKDDIIGMRLLTGFQTDHSAYGRFVLLQSSFVDTMSYVCPDKENDYPDQEIMIRLEVAKELIHELQKRVDYIEAGIENNAVHLVD
ncbi:MULTISPECIES: hypothetical protein [Serratia]|uniref:hypothetical protein n=1 Tax=Serratia TaxID=613 RepID=UPI000CF6BCAE|nr:MULTISPECIES: hypothetical protein [Serratia]AVJ17227.1 hypothetical protein CLM71_08830 [Serratia sp. MYb239]MBS0971879.1 hypothetical protein [Serratia rubidaea]MDC6111314.1 hypothetical protein [Serratia rubidaea]SQJ21709.1 Uncharacterised protein [Serratia rubidaea]